MKILQQAGVAFLELVDFRADDEITVRLVFMVLVIILVIILGFVKRIERLNMRNDWLVVGMLFLEILDKAIRSRTLAFVRIENDRTILRSDVVALAVQSRRVMGKEKDSQQVLVRNDRRIKFNFCRFGVAGRSTADLFIGRIRNRAARIARSRGDDALQPRK